MSHFAYESLQQTSKVSQMNCKLQYKCAFVAKTKCLSSLGISPGSTVLNDYTVIYVVLDTLEPQNESDFNVSSVK